MRSRFSAFAVGDAAYLIASWHPSTRPASLELSTDLEWRRLEVLGATAGAKDDRDGTVEFVAYYWDTASRQHGLQRENSAFSKVHDEWFYVGPAS